MAELKLSNRVNKVEPSPTLALSAKAAELKAEGRDIISLTAGEPDFDTPQHIKDAAIQAIQEGQTKYTAVDGTPALKKAVQEKFKTQNNLEYPLEGILVSSGAKQSIYNLFQALLDTGNEVIIPAPYWVSYPEMVKLADATPVIVKGPACQNYKITPEQLEQAITPKTKLFLINSPSNPSGACYTQSELEGLAKVLVKHPHVWIVSDDMYEHILWQDEPFQNLVNVCPELKSRTVVINGASKAYAMTGWRIGFAAGPTPVIKAMKKIQSQSTSNPCSVSQAAAVAALTGDFKIIEYMRDAYKDRHDYLTEALNQIPGINCLPADGTFYTFPDVSELIASHKDFNNDTEFANYLLDKLDIAVVPGSAFGIEGAVRMSYATSMKNLKKTVERLHGALASE